MVSINVTELQKRSLFIATPMYGGKCDYGYVNGLIKLVQFLVSKGITYKIYFMSNESLIQRARNYCANEFMKSGMTHLLFIDADICFTEKDVVTLLALAEPQSDKDVVVGLYPKKTIAWEKIKVAATKKFAEDNPKILSQFGADFVFNPLKNQDININDPVEVAEAGTGFMMIQRKALEKFCDSYPEYYYKPDHVRQKGYDGSEEIMQFFHCEIDPDTKRYRSEDYWFCFKARNIGIKIWAVPWLNLSHIGSYTFAGSMQAMAAIQASPTVDIRQLKK